MVTAMPLARMPKSVCEILEKNYTNESIEVEDLPIKLIMKALLEVV